LQGPPPPLRPPGTPRWALGEEPGYERSSGQAEEGEEEEEEKETRRGEAWQLAQPQRRRSLLDDAAPDGGPKYLECSDEKIVARAKVSAGRWRGKAVHVCA
jgi:hypothetical protein